MSEAADFGARVDSPEGIRMLLAWAKGGGFVLNQAHRAIAEKHGADTSGVLFSQRIPTKWAG